MLEKDGKEEGSYRERDLGWPCKQLMLCAIIFGHSAWSTRKKSCERLSKTNNNICWTYDAGEVKKETDFNEKRRIHWKRNSKESSLEWNSSKFLNVLLVGNFVVSSGNQPRMLKASRAKRIRQTFTQPSENIFILFVVQTPKQTYVLFRHCSLHVRFTRLFS